MILLDDAQSTQTEPSSRLYEQALHCWTVYPQPSRAETITAVDECLRSINTSLTRGE